MAGSLGCHSLWHAMMQVLGGKEGLQAGSLTWTESGGIIPLSAFAAASWVKRRTPSAGYSALGNQSQEAW